MHFFLAQAINFCRVFEQGKSQMQQMQSTKTSDADAQEHIIKVKGVKFFMKPSSAQENKAF